MDTSSREESVTAEWPPPEDTAVSEWTPDDTDGMEWPPAELAATPPRPDTGNASPSEPAPEAVVVAEPVVTEHAVRAAPAADTVPVDAAEATVPVEPVGAEDAVHAAPAEPDGPGADRPKGSKKRKLPWKPVAGGVVVVLIGWQVVHGMTRSGGESARPSASSAAPTVASPTPKRTHVELGNLAVPVGGQPIILLNPGLVAPGGTVSLQGSGFDAGSTVGVTLRTKGSPQGTDVAMSKTGKDGSFAAQFPAPQSLDNAAVTVVAQEKGSSKEATAELMAAGGAATVTISGKGAGKPGDQVTINGTGFSPGETVRAYWGRTTGTPSATLTADSSGSLSKATVPVGLAPVGTTTLVLVGQTSHATAVAPFQMLGLYPTTTPHPYALQPGKTMTYTGAGFAPGEQVLVYVNSASGTPALSVQARSDGSFSTSFDIPYGLTGRQTLTTIGAQSRASTTTGFTVLPFSPSVQASTYGAMPGTSISFYASGFAPNEVVEVYLGRGQGNDGQLVTAFRTDGKGSAAAAGQYVIPGNTGPTLVFTLVGQTSGGSGTAKVSVTPSAQPVSIPQQAPYVLPPELGGKVASSSASSSSLSSSTSQTPDSSAPGSSTPPTSAPNSSTPDSSVPASPTN